MRQAVSGSTPTSAYATLVQERNRFTVIMVVTFMVLYFLLPVLAGYAKDLMATRVYGHITFGYLLAFAEFIMGWVLAAIYVRRARAFDRLAEEARA